MKYLITVFLMGIVLLANGISFKEISLSEVIDEAELICRGEIINVTKTDSLTTRLLRGYVKTEEFRYGDPNCGLCDEMATFVIHKTLKGKRQNDTLLIPFHQNPYFVLPGFVENKEYILFLNEFKGNDFQVKVSARFGSKSSNLNEYEKAIINYLSLKRESEIRDWVIALCVNPFLTKEGVVHLGKSYMNNLTVTEEELLCDGLLKMDFKKGEYLVLLEKVQDFGKNEVLLAKCLSRVKNIEINEVDEGQCLLEAINSMNPRSEYQNIIDQLYSSDRITVSPSKKLELIKLFAEIN